MPANHMSKVLVKIDMKCRNDCKRHFYIKEILMGDTTRFGRQIQKTYEAFCANVSITEG